MTITDVQLAQAADIKLVAAETWLPWVNEAMDRFEINTAAREAAFLSQISHESGGFHWVREIWGPTPAQKGYEGRKDLGNTMPGDGFRYCGRGLIQITGRINYLHCRDGLLFAGIECPDFVEDPEALEKPRWAALSAGWFWHSRSLNNLADIGDYERITRRINGGLNGYEARVALWEQAKEVLA